MIKADIIFKIQKPTKLFLACFLLFLLVVTDIVNAQTQTFNTSGTFTVPAGVTSITVECWGGGGSGGGNSANTSLGGGGGAGGAYARSVITVVPGNNYTVTVGSTEIGTNGAGIQGNPSWFGSVATIYAQGGAGGAAPNGGTANGGTGSSASSIGTTVYAGGNGANGTTTIGGAGGGGAGSTGSGGAAAGTTSGTGTSIGGGAGGAGRNDEGNGNSGSNYGGGGGGAFIPDNTNHSGGNGAAGQVIVTWVASNTTDYFRSRATGNWNSISTWESSTNGTNWINATLTPTSAANTITIQNTHIVTVTASVTVDQVTVNTGGQITVNTGQTLTIANGAGTDMTVDGILVNSGTITTTGTVAFNSGSTYQHARDGGAIPTATWNSASNCNITGITSSTGFTGGLGQTFGNFTWNCPLQTTNFYLASNIAIAGNFTVSETSTAPADPNTKSLRISNTATGYTMTVTGDVIINNDAAFKMNNGTGSCLVNVGGNFTINNTAFVCLVSGGASSTLSVAGNVNIAGGTLCMHEDASATIGTLNVGGNFTLFATGTITETSTGSGAINFNGNSTRTYTNSGGTISNTINFAILSGAIVDFGTSIINGSIGTFTLNSGAGIITAHTQGLSTTAATGSIQVTGTKTYNAGANYTYDGTSAQVTGNGLTGANNLTINNAAGVTLTSNTTVSGTLNLTSGILTTGANTITVTNNSTSAVTGGSTTSFVNGPLIWQLATGQTYSFPVGKGTTYLPFGLTGITGTTPRLRVEAFTGNAGGSATAPLVSLSTTEYWSASVVAGTYTNGSVSLTRQSALGEFGTIGRSATQGGTYSSLNGTVSSTSIINSDNTGNSLGYFVMAAKRSITTSSISGSPFCAGAAVSVPFTITGIFTSGNIFTAQLSNASGSFTTPQTLGTLTSITSGSISGNIQLGTASGSGYRIRVVSSTPAVTGTVNVSNLTVNPDLPVSVSIAASANPICPGTSVTFTATPTNGGTTPSYQWILNGGNVGTNSTTYTNAALANGNTVTCVLTSNATPCATGNPATSNAITMTVNSTPTAPTANAGSGASCTQITANWTASANATSYLLDVSTDNFGSFVTGYSGLNVFNVTTYNVTGLTAGTTYYYRVRAVNNCGTSASSSTITYATSANALLAPVAIAGVGAACTQITARWTASVNATSYWLDVSTNIGFSSFVSGYQALDVLNVTTYNVTGLTAGTTYYYRVRAANSCGVSVNSSIITYATLAAAPLAPTANAGSGAACTQITANWTASTNTTSYRLDVSTDNLFGSFVTGYNDLYVVNVTTYAITGLTAGTTYYYRVRAANSCGTSPSSGVITYATLAGASAPTAIAGSGAGCTQITANWSASANATSYRLDVSTDIGFGSFVPGYNDLNVLNVTTYAVTGLTASTTYYYRVRTVNGCGTSASSNIITYATTTAPAQPSAITGSASPCLNFSQTYSVTNVSGVTYTWTIPAGWTQTGGGTTYSITVTVGAGSGNVQVTPSNGTCSGSPSTLAVIPTPGVPAQSSIITGSTTPCQASSQIYSVINDPEVTYSWIFPGVGWTITSGGTTNSVTVTVGTGSGNIEVRPVNSCGNGAAQTLAVSPTASLPAQPSAITGSVTPCQASSQTYSVANVPGVTYNWTFPAGWTQTGGGTTYSVTVTVGTGSGDVQVTPSNGICPGPPSTLSVITTTAPATTNALICIGSTATLSASGAVAGGIYRWYNAATGGTLLKASTNNADNTYVTPVLASTTNYWVSILNAGGCESSRTQVTATFPSASLNDPNAAGSDYWIGHVYDGMGFTTYYGTYTEGETFNQLFGGNITCFSLNSSLGTRSIYTETFSVKYMMNSTKRGLYVVDLGSDDGSRLTVDGTLLYNNWMDQAYTSRTRVLMNLNGASSLKYEYYENGGGNQVVFQTLTPVMSNTLTTGISQSIFVGGAWSTISGNVFGILPTGITLSGTGYQWTYSTTPSGTRTVISGATGATYTPSASVAPFNTPGTYYLFRNAILSSTNNVSPNPYVATNESNAAVLTISNVPAITTSLTTLTGFSYPFGFGPSGEQSFTVSGTNLSANLVITPNPPANFEISTGTGVLFVPTSPIVLLVNNGNVSTTTIYVRMKAGLPIGAVTAENIVCSSNGLTPKYVACSGAVTSVPTITTSLTSLSDFSYPYTAGPSSQQTFTVSGTNLVANVTVTPPASFEISTTSGSGFVSTPISLTQTGGTLNTTTIYVRLKAGLGIGGYSENIVSSSTSATSKNVTCNGTVNGSNTISLSTSSLAGFIYTSGAGPSAPQSFTVSGTLLTNNMVITPATNYEICLTSGGTYQSTALTLIPSGGTVNATNIYVRLKAGLAVGTYPPNNIPVSSAGAITKSVGCSGAVVNTPTIMVSKSTLTGFGYMAAIPLSSGGPSSPQSFTVSGASLLANVSITPPANYEISLSSGSGYQSTPITLTQIGGILSPTTIYARLKSGLTAGNYTGVDITAASGAVTRNVACVGIVFVSPLITAGGPGTACAGSNVTLTSVGESTILNRFWQGPNSFYSTVQNPVLTNVTTAMSGTYTVTGNVVVGGNLVTNGDFELGNTSFGSSYALAAQTVDGLWPESTYDVIANPNSRHANFIACSDHTPGTGTMQMVVNGSPVAGAVIWTQSVPVIPEASYEFTYWVQSVVALAPSQLQLYINGVAVGPVYTADLATCSWKQFAYNATSGNNTSLNLELINQNTIANGNDFALDDIVFQQILPDTSTVNLTVNPLVPVSVSLVANPNPTTTGTNVTFTATPVNGGLTPNYEWFVNNGTLPVASGSSPTYSSSSLSNNDIVTVRLTSSLACVTGNPASASVVMIMTPRVNYWHGTVSTVWGNTANWTANYIPAAGEDVEFATIANWGSDAVRDLHLDINRTIGSLIDATNKSTVITSGLKLTVNRNLYLGSLAHINASAAYSTIEFAGTLPQTIPANTFINDEIYDILINNAHNVTLYGTLRLDHEITANAGRLDATTTMPTVVYSGDYEGIAYGAQIIEMNRYLNNSLHNLTIYNIHGVWLATTASILVPNDLTVTRGVLTVPPGATLTVDRFTKLDYRAPLPDPYPLEIDYWSCLVLKSDAILTGSLVHNGLASFSGIGTVKVERYMSRSNNWHLYSSPINNQSINDFLKYNPEIPDLFPIGSPHYGTNPDGVGMRPYNTVANIWDPYYVYPNVPTTPGSIGLGKGFNIRTIYNYTDPVDGLVPGTSTVDATGFPNDNTVNVALTRSVSPDWGWNCIGNPFACALNIRDVANNGFLNAANTSQLDPNYKAVYVWDTNNITTTINTPGNVQLTNNTPEYIVINDVTTITSVQTGQGFFVKSKLNGGSVTFTKAMQFPNALLSFKAAVVEWPSIKIVARDQTSSRSTEIKFVSNTSKGMDPGYDAGLYRANPNFEIYSKLVDDNAIDYTLQCLPDQDYDQYVIPIGIDHKVGDQITFTAKTTNLPSGCKVVLEDRLYNTFIRLDLKDAKYRVSLDHDTKGTGRFFLHTSDVIGSNPSNIEKLNVFSVAKNIYITGAVSEDARFYLYAVNGKLLANFTAQNQLQNQLDASAFASGVYLLTIIDRNQRKTIKFVLEN